MTTRGIRNNNPGNLRKSKDQWLGLTDSPSEDPDFLQFKEMKYGCRALIKVLQTYVNVHKSNTIAKIISRWAPSNENDTEAYIDSVSSFVKLNSRVPINFEKRPDLWIKLAKAIARHENGKDAELISEEDWKFACESCNVIYE